MIITIPSKNNYAGLSALLVNLQPQLDNDDIIYVADNSEDHSIRKLVKMYATSRCITLVEGGKYPLLDSWKHGFELCVKEGQDGVLTLEDDVLLSMTFIANLKRAIRMSEYPILVPVLPEGRWDSIDPNFVYYSKSTQASDIVVTKEVHEWCYFAKREVIEDNQVDITKHKIGCLTNEYVWHFGL